MEADSAEELTHILDPTSFTCYTDGSKHHGKVGAAVVIRNPSGSTVLSKKLKLHDVCSVFQAEMAAIDQACQLIITKKLSPAIILTDSKSSLMELSNHNSTNHLCNNIFKSLHLAKHHNINISFIWIRSHIGISGNEEADLAAKSAANSHSSPSFSKFPLSYIKHHFMRLSKAELEDLYDTTDNCQYTKQWCSNYA
ncbi:uncharacterized protein LOC131845414 [Achroia grisella]|uniref:uncharacterized protein LOC131845414 n=1 Tax=Achroia grisella TaxID=688607 RepID=UPI0027D24F79|nr:uncharacterized protein LOC131845414 [Achroia grisella]